MAYLLGLMSAIVWGAGDFCGGLASRRAPLLTVLIVAEFTGFCLLVASAFLVNETFPASPAVAYSVAAGLSGTIGLGCLYRGLAIGRASIVAPVSAVIGAAIPALFTAHMQGLPGELKLAGFALALAAIVLASQSSHEAKTQNALPFGLLAGLGFGGFFVLMDQASGPHSTFLPLAIARSFPIPIMLVICLVRNRTMLPTLPAVPLVVLTGILDAAGTVFFLLSSTFGRLDVATILSSLYPASTVILSRLILREQISLLQKLGVVLALTAIVLIVW
ncbi:DMT family transporter [bacterium]|nr:DMT family transporter [bacterium]MCI0601462.1 DMT family transporter [bacterium]